MCSSDLAPVYWDPVQKLWAISRYDDIMAVEREGVRYSSFRSEERRVGKECRYRWSPYHEKKKKKEEKEGETEQSKVRRLIKNKQPVKYN